MQIERPVIYARPDGVSSAHIDDFLIFQAAIIVPGGVGWMQKTGDIRAIPLSPRAVELLVSLLRHSK